MAGAGRETLRFPEILLWASIAYFLAGWTCGDTPHPLRPRDSSSPGQGGDVCSAGLSPLQTHAVPSPFSTSLIAGPSLLGFRILHT